MTWTVISDPLVEPAISLDVNRIDRNDDGRLAYDVDIDYEGLGPSEGPCVGKRPCYITLQGKTKAGAVVSINGSYLWESQQYRGTVQLASSASQPAIAAFRAVTEPVDPADSTPWNPINDPIADPSLSVRVNRIDRNDDGRLAYDVDIDYEGLGPSEGPCVGKRPCYITLQGKTKAGAVVSINGSYLWESQQYRGTVQLASSASQPAIAAFRAVTEPVDPADSTPWNPINDPIADPSISLVINQVLRNDAGDLDYDVDVLFSGLGPQQGPCVGQSPCYVSLQAKRADGTVVILDSRYFWTDSQYRGEFKVARTSTSPTVVALRARVTPTSTTDQGGWIPVTEGIRAGHDTEEAYALVIAAAAASSNPCLIAFPAGTHTQKSSVSDQYLACSAAVSGGQTFRQFMTAFLKTASPRTITNLLSAAGIATSEATAQESYNLDFEKTLPPGCSWTGLLTISCNWGPQPKTFRPISAPPAQDEIWKNNQRAKAQRTNPVTPITPVTPGPNPTPQSFATAENTRDFVTEECERAMYKWGDANGLPENACETMQIFATGKDSEEATLHDAEAIAANPAWFVLSYSKQSEKAAPRKTWANTGNCAGQLPGQHCDEFPYYSTAEGYPTANPPSLKPISGSSDNSVQGGNLSGFFNNPKCDFQTSAPNSEGRLFLVVPIKLLNTQTVCRR